MDRLVDTGHDVQSGRPGTRPDDVPRLPGRPDPAAGQARRPGAARRSTAFRPDLVHVTSPGTVGRKALKHGPAPGIPTLVVEQSRSSTRSPIDLAQPDRRARRPRCWSPRRGCSTGWRSGRRRRRVGARASTPPRSPPRCATTWLHDRWSRARSLARAAGRGRVRRQPAQPPRRTPAGRARPGARHPAGGRRRRPAARLARGPAARTRSSPARLATGDLTAVLPTFDVLVAPGRRRRPAATRCARRPPAAYRWSRRAPAAPSTSSATWRPGCSTTRGTPARAARRRRTRVVGRPAASPARRPRAASWPPATWPDAVDELVDRHYRAAASLRQAATWRGNRA